jgi:ComF family protein
MPLIAELAAIARRLVPEHCPRRGLAADDGYCSACRRDFARIRVPCARCGLPQPCQACPSFAPHWQLDSLRAPFAYAPPLSAELQALKYGKQRRLGLALGRLLVAELDVSCTDADALVPVPLHPARLRQRTFNQADEIARPLARSLSLPLLFQGIRRLRDTEPQTTLDRQARLFGLSRAFAVTEDAVCGLNLAIIDDVITTGATVNALAAALRAAGAATVTALAVARTPGDASDAAQAARNR